MKKLLLLFLASMLCLYGCSSLQIGAVESNTSNKMSASYYRFSGSKECTLTVKEGHPITISAEIETKKGRIDAYIYRDKDDKDSYDYEGHDIKTSEFTVKLKTPGKYTIKVVSDQHKGSYSFKW